AKHDRKIVAAEGGKKKSASKIDLSKKPATAKLPKPVSSKKSKPAPAKQSKLVKEKSTKPTPLQKADKGKVDYDLHQGIQMSLESFQPPIGGVAFREPDSGTDIAKQISRKRLKPDKHEHGNGRAHKELGECYQKSTVVNSSQPYEDTNPKIPKNSPLKITKLHK
ncbi:hypothetical protein Tco_1137399, partial [Tanacetum coccineum]